MMVREGKSFRQAATECNVPMTTEDAENFFRRAAFQRVLRQSRHRFHMEIGRDPERTKSATIGQLQVCADNLMKEGDFAKAAEVLLKISKIEGWVGPDSSVNVFSGLSQAQIDQARETLRKKIADGQPTNTGTESLLN